MSKYKLTNPKIDGEIYVVFESGYIRTIEFELNKPLSQQQWNTLTTYLSNTESEIHNTKFKAELIEGANVKIALFCSFYLHYKGVKYKVSKAETGKIKLIEVSAQLLQKYFTSENFLFKNKHSISNLVKYYNELRAEMAKPTTKHPNKYDRDYEKKLGVAEQQQYWQHMSSIGLKPVKNSQGQIVDWK